ncbi:MAG: hypothetical protein NTW25_14010 [Candidatus Kapabacteria bacterium]|nr:hypothetical protein [Candidatus Kapabacteria bacterium]
MKSSILLMLSIIFFVSCSNGSYNIKYGQNIKLISNQNISVIYANHSNNQISNDATEVLEKYLTDCNKNILNADKVEKLLKQNNAEVPRRINLEYLKSLKNILKTDYVIISTVDQWQDGEYKLFGRTVSAKVGMSLEIYDLTNGELVISAFGSDEADKSMSNPSAKEFSYKVIKRLLSQWESFCKVNEDVPLIEPK